MDYVINPVLMGGLVKEVTGDAVKVHLHGRLGVLTVPRRLILGNQPLESGHELQFYFSYLEVDGSPMEYDLTELETAAGLLPILAGGVLTEVNDTAVVCTLPSGMGTVAVPRRWVFTDVPLREGLTARFYLSPMNIIGKRALPAEPSRPEAERQEESK
ncbi:MAG: CBO2463/CBO2479 domain-containing protein [Oscillospiraceae bacterium]